MKLVNRSEVNEEKWQEWCAKSIASQPFLSLPYLDAVSEQLAFVVNASETGGMPLPYFEKLGVKTLYMPVFCRWTDWVGEGVPEKAELNAFLTSNFKECDIYFRQDLLKAEAGDLIYQGVTQEQFKLNSQAKRKVKAIDKEAYTFSTEVNIAEGVKIIRNELTGKFTSLQDKSFASLEVLLSNLNKISVLKSVSIHKDDQLCGVLFLVQTETTILYLKGACAPEVKNKGGMYALMNRAILTAFESNLNFDFGGSRVEGVRRFNRCFGGQDINYFEYKWSNGPFWYKAAKTVKNKWIKK